MNAPRTADEAYYAAKFPSPMRSTREGRKRKIAHRSYAQPAPGAARRDDIYYAEPAVVSPKNLPEIKSATLEVQHDNWTETLQLVQRLFEQGNAIINIRTTNLLATQGQTAFDLAVGRGLLTRDQVSAIRWWGHAPSPSTPAVAVAPEPAPVVDAAAAAPAVSAEAGTEIATAETAQSPAISKRRGRPKKSGNTAVELMTSVEPSKPADFSDELDLSDEFDLGEDRSRASAETSASSYESKSEIIDNIAEMFDTAAAPVDSDD